MGSVGEFSTASETVIPHAWLVTAAVVATALVNVVVVVAVVVVTAGFAVYFVVEVLVTA